MATPAPSPVRAGLAALLALSGTIGSFAQPPADPIRPTFRSSVDLVEVTVAVTDGDGRSVTDLTADDFELFDDGAATPVASFGQVTVPVEPFRLPATEAAGVGSNLVREGGGRTYLFVLDDLHTHPLRTDEVRGLVRRFVEQHLAANDLAGLAVVSGADAPEPLTEDRSRLLAAADRFLGRDQTDAVGEALRGENPFAALSVDPLSGMGFTDRGVENDLWKASQLLQTLRMGADWLAETSVRRKAIVLVSQGLAYDTTDPMADRNATALLDELARTAEQVSRHDVVLYAIDPRGLPTGDPGPIQTRSLVGEVPFSPAMWRSKEVLHDLAEPTGGFAFINSNQFDQAFTDVVEQNSSYYLLGFQPTREEPDGALHEISVRVRRPGVTVRARRRYVHSRGGDAEETRPPADRIEALLERPGPESGLPLRLAAAPVRRQGGTALAVTIELPPSRRAGSGDGPVALVLEATDMRGRVLARRETTAQVPPTLTEARTEAGLRVLARLALPEPEAIRLRAAGVDLESGLSGSADLVVQIPDLSSARLALGGVTVAPLPMRPVPTMRAGPPVDDLLVVPPGTGRTFDADDVVGVFAELYPPGPVTFEVRCQVTAVDGTVLFELTQSRETDGRVVAYQADLSLDEIPPGPAVVTLEARIVGSEEVVARRIPIAVGDGARR